MKKEEMLSLYDFLGKAAGPDLGKEVFNQAKITKTPFQMRLVSNTKYRGKVMLYPKSFLEIYFRK